MTISGRLGSETNPYLGECRLCGHGVFHRIVEGAHEQCLPRAEALTAFRLLGFDAWTTGGGCMALGRDIEGEGNVRSIMLTNGDADFPDNDAVSVGLLGPEETGEFCWFEFKGYEQAARFVELALIGLGVP